MRLLFRNLFSIFSEILKYTVMENFKTIDFWVNVLLIACFILLKIPACIKEGGLLNNQLLEGYFIVGSWQVISMIIHVVNSSFIKKWGARFVYSWISLLAIITIPVGSFWVLVFTAPFMAIYYTCICYQETYVKMKRPMDLLK